MKKIILSIALFAVIGIANAMAAGDGSGSSNPSKKSEPIVRNILSDKLPSRLLSPIKKDYKDYWITNLYKTSGSGKTAYCITIENADKKITMNATSSSTWSISQVITKE